MHNSQNKPNLIGSIMNGLGKSRMIRGMRLGNMTARVKGYDRERKKERKGLKR